MKTAAREEFGDFQTPIGLTNEVCRLVRTLHGDFDVVVEPTCGVGAFLHGAAAAFPNAQLMGYEINEAHLARAKASLTSSGNISKATLAQQDFFTADWKQLLPSHGSKLLLLGNPPWVTNSAVAALAGSNVPAKTNFQGLNGMAARTGKANFDISEWMLIRLIEAVRPRQAVMAMLCKTATARKVLRDAWRRDGRVKQASLYRIDAAKHFGVSVDACLFIAELGASGPHEATLNEGLFDGAARTRFGLSGHDLVANLDVYRRWSHLEGQSPYRWRSGLKHDCAAVMELTSAGSGRFRNQLGECFPLEPDVVYPFLKSTPLSHGRLSADRWILLTQHKVGESTQHLAVDAPNAWSYLQSHADRFAARKSSIYQRGDPFALFGIGDYAFQPWKVAISGLHRPPRFHVVAPDKGRPVMLDDTCYFLSFSSEDEARLVASVYNSKACAEFIGCLASPEAKRPITVDLLHRIDFRELASECGLFAEWEKVRHGSDTQPAPVPLDPQLSLLMEKPAELPKSSKR